MNRSLFARALALDLVLLIVFAAIGRNSHDEGLGAAGILTTAAPFMIGYVFCAGLTRLDRAPLSPVRAALAWAPGIAVGMVLRRVVFDRGTAWSFVVVAFVATAVLLLGWRVIGWIVRRVRSQATIA